MHVDHNLSAGVPEDYEVPLQGMVPPDPSFDDMRRVVVVERRQPAIPPRWNSEEVCVCVCVCVCGSYPEHSNVHCIQQLVCSISIPHTFLGVGRCVIQYLCMYGPVKLDFDLIVLLCGGTNYVFCEITRLSSTRAKHPYTHKGKVIQFG